jgi:hypothetical protein
MGLEWLRSIYKESKLKVSVHPEKSMWLRRKKMELGSVAVPCGSTEGKSVSISGLFRMGRRSYNHTRKLKQLVQYTLKMLQSDGRHKCFFCSKSLLIADLLKITVHHINGNHEDDRPENLALSHDRCHRGYHAKVILHGIQD